MTELSGKNIKRLMRIHGKTIDGLAKAMNVTKSAFGKFVLME